ncbi:MAG: alpha/beta hydrolase [Eubacteriales bacterium]
MQHLTLHRSEGVQLDAYILAHETLRPAMLVIPGGCYQFVSQRENKPVAMKFAELGYNTFVLTYTVNQPPLGQRPLEDASWAMGQIHEHAEEWHLMPGHTFVCGFSAGGHLTAWLGNCWNDPDLWERTGIAPGSNRPDGLILAYPVISSGPYAHATSFEMLAGPKRENDQAFSQELLVNDDTPPAFLWHTQQDGTVDIHNSLLYMQAMVEHGRPIEAHFFPWGDHGFSVATPLMEEFPGLITRTADPYVARWTTLAHQWMQEMISRRDKQ